MAAAELCLTMGVLCAVHADMPFAQLIDMLSRTITRIDTVRKAQKERN
jgi:hypothetical protein